MVTVLLKAAWLMVMKFKASKPLKTKYNLAYSVLRRLVSGDHTVREWDRAHCKLFKLPLGVCFRRNRKYRRHAVSHWVGLVAVKGDSVCATVVGSVLAAKRFLRFSVT